MSAARKMTTGQARPHQTVNRVQCSGGRSGGQRSDLLDQEGAVKLPLRPTGYLTNRLEGAVKLPLLPIDNLIHRTQGAAAMQAQKRMSSGPQRAESSLAVGHRANIKDKISQWEGKEAALSPAKKNQAATTSEPSRENTEPGKENIGNLGDVRPSSSPLEPGREEVRREEVRREEVRREEVRREEVRREEVRREEVRKEEVRKEEVRREEVRKEEMRKEEMRREEVRREEVRKEEVRKEEMRKEEMKREEMRKEEVRREEMRKEEVRKEEVRREEVRREEVRREEVRKEEMRKEEVRKEEARKVEVRRPAGGRQEQQGTEERRAVFTLFRKLEEAMASGTGQAPPELPGSYFCPPGRDRQLEARRRELEAMMGGLGKDQENQENLYTEPGSLPINPVPKPRRTFRHPPQINSHPGVRNLPPLPSASPPPPPDGSSRARPDRQRDHAHRKSFAFEGPPGPHPLPSSSQDHHYEDIPDSRENPYEDIEVDSQSSQQSLPSSPSSSISKGTRPGFFRQNSGKRSLKLLDLRRPHPAASVGLAMPPQHSPPSSPDNLTWPPYQPLRRRIPTVVLKINAIFQARVGKKRLRRINHPAETSSGRVTENSDSESEAEDRARAQQQRLVSVRSILSRPGRYQSQDRCCSDRELRNALHQRQLFDYFLVVSLQRAKPGAPYLPEVTQQFPLKLERSFKFLRESEDQLRVVPQFCFPDASDWQPVDNYPSETFSFVLTGVDGSRRFGYCRRLLPSGKGKRLPEVYCIVSHLSCFNLFSKVLVEVERRRALSPALVLPFMRAIMEAPFPAPGRTITIKTFLPGAGTEVMALCRPSESCLEQVEVECLFSCLSVKLLVRVVASLLLERRVIFTAHNLSAVSQACHAAVALLYPFSWQHTYVPVLPASMLDMVCSPTPFIVGLLAGALPQITQLPLEEVLVVDLDNSRFLRQLDDEDSILPSKLQSALEHVLERRKELSNERGADLPNDSAHLGAVVSEAFVRFFVELVGHYPLFMCEHDDESSSSSSPVPSPSSSSSSPAPSSLQREAFLRSVCSRSLRRFLEAFMETQMFSCFVQEREQQRQDPRGLFEVRVQEYLDSLRDNEHRRVARFLKGLGSKIKSLSKKKVTVEQE